MQRSLSSIADDVVQEGGLGNKAQFHSPPFKPQGHLWSCLSMRHSNSSTGACNYHHLTSGLPSSLEMGSEEDLGRRIFSSRVLRFMCQEVKSLQIKLWGIMCMSDLHYNHPVIHNQQVFVHWGKNRNGYFTAYIGFTSSLGKIIRELIMS